MAKINLLKKEWIGNRQVKRLRFLAQAIMVLAVGGFLLQTFYVAGRLVYLRSKIASTKDEIQLFNNIFERDKTSVENYVWAQGVLEKIGKEKDGQHEYKKYLDEINNWLTPGTSLVGVSFTEEDEITFSVFTNGVDQYRSFEENLGLKQQEEDFGFGLVEQKSLSRAKDGSYVVSIRLKI